MPNEHGFWVMLAASVLGAALRAGLSYLTLVTSCLVVGTTVLVARHFHRAIRRREGAQLGATAALALTGTPVEWVSGLPFASVLAGTVARAAIFVASALLVRSAFARSARGQSVRCRALQSSAIAILALTGILLALGHQYAEARASALALSVCLLLAWGKPTAKQLKPLGLTLAGLALTSAIALTL